MDCLSDVMGGMQGLAKVERDLCPAKFSLFLCTIVWDQV